MHFVPRDGLAWRTPVSAKDLPARGFPVPRLADRPADISERIRVKVRLIADQVAINYRKADITDRRRCSTSR